MVTTRPFRSRILMWTLAVALLAAGGCALEPPEHNPWPTLPEGGSSTKTGVEGGKGSIPVAEKDKGGGGGGTSGKDAGGTEN